MRIAAPPVRRPVARPPRSHPPGMVAANRIGSLQARQELLQERLPGELLRLRPRSCVTFRQTSCGSSEMLIRQFQAQVQNTFGTQVFPRFANAVGNLALSLGGLLHRLELAA